ncbi:ATP-binding protein [Oscillospiraceae bacterium OttesenSCG-928-G22]|nr:ATP-binding protein [Oscillospiraceae bacterium OttesenSCG-928-G22]
MSIQAGAMGFLLYLFESVMLFITLSPLLCRRRPTRVNSAIFILLLTTLQYVKFVIDTYAPTIPPILYSVALDYIVIFLFYRGKPAKKLFYLVVFYAFMFLCDAFSLLILYLFGLADPIPVDSVASIELVPLFVILLSRLLLPLLITLFIRFIKKQDMEITKWAYGLPVPFLACVFLTFFFPYGTVANLFYTRPLGMFFICLLLFTLMALFFAGFLVARGKEKQYKEKVTLLDELNRSEAERMNTFYENQKRLSGVIHDFENHLDFLMLKAGERSDTEVSGYIVSIRREWSNTYTETGNRIVDAVLFLKRGVAEGKGVKLRVDGYLPQNIDWIAPEEIVPLLGNALDNAIEACACLEVSESATINACFSYRADTFAFTLTNPCISPESMPDGRLKSRKRASDHGIGMENMKKIAERYDGHLNHHVDHGLFELTVLLQKPNC